MRGQHSNWAGRLNQAGASGSCSSAAYWYTYLWGAVRKGSAIIILQGAYEAYFCPISGLRLFSLPRYIQISTSWIQTSEAEVLIAPKAILRKSPNRHPLLFGTTSRHSSSCATSLGAATQPSSKHQKAIVSGLPRFPILPIKELPVLFAPRCSRKPMYV